MRKLFCALLLSVFAVSRAAAFDEKNLAEALEMAELSKNMNGDGSEEMGTPRDVKGAGRWMERVAEGKDESTGKAKGWGFKKYCNRWALFRSTKPGEKNVYAIVLRGTIDSPRSILQDALAVTSDASKLWFKDNFPSDQEQPRDEGHLLQLAEDAKAAVHMGFAAGLVDILFHRDGQALIERLRGLEDDSVVYITGHSQGAALATLLHAFLLNRSSQINAGYGLANKKLHVTSYVFAQPKPADWNFAMDFSRALFREGQSSFVINNSWDWVPQAPLSFQWPSEFTDRLLESFGGTSKPGVDRLIKFAGTYAGFESTLRKGLSDGVRTGVANIRTPEEVKQQFASLKGLKQARDLITSLAAGDPSGVLKIAFRDPTFSNELGDFNDDLNRKDLTDKIPDPALLRPHPGASANFMPVGTLVALPLVESRAPKKDDDLTLQHHMRLYITSLQKMQEQIKQRAPTQVAAPVVVFPAAPH